jgi:hypothetical protein
MPTNYECAFADRPAVYAAWAQLNGAIKAGMDLRRYELTTLAAARRLRSSYCCLAHGTVLQERFDESVLKIALDHHAAGLDQVDVAVMDLAERVVDDATSIGDADLKRLRELGLSETEVMDVILAAAARCFFSKTLDAQYSGMSHECTNDQGQKRWRPRRVSLPFSVLPSAAARKEKRCRYGKQDQCSCTHTDSYAPAPEPVCAYKGNAP